MPVRDGINEADARRKAATDARLRERPKENYIIVEIGDYPSCARL
jgi:hypothetical protein